MINDDSSDISPEGRKFLARAPGYHGASRLFRETISRAGCSERERSRDIVCLQVDPSFVVGSSAHRVTGYMPKFSVRRWILAKTLGTNRELSGTYRSRRDSLANSETRGVSDVLRQMSKENARLR